MQGYVIIHNSLTEKEMQDVLNLKSAKKKRALGVGSTAKVYPFPKESILHNDWVYRVQKQNYEFGVEPYLQFAGSMVSSKSRHLPKCKFLAVRRNSYGEVAELITVIEKLTSWREHYRGIKNIWVYHLEDYLLGWDLDGGELREIRRKKGFTQSSIRHLRTVFEKRGVEVNDLHDENVMVRRDGTIVVTDPSC